MKNTVSLSSGSSIDQIAQLIGSSSCKCDCDSSDRNDRISTTLETTTTQYQNEADYGIGSNAINSRSNTNLKSTNIIIFVITPTYTRPTQMADMTRLSQTLRLVKDIFWVVVEDSHNRST